MTTSTEPTSVMLLREALSERLGRPACARPSKGAKPAWVVSDPSFGWIQRGSKGVGRSYRSGILVADDQVYFYNEHSRALADLFRKNLKTSPNSLMAAAEVTRDLRGYHLLHWSSRSKARKTGGDTFDSQRDVLEAPSWQEFSMLLAKCSEILPGDLFPVLQSRGIRGGEARLAGTFFLLLLAEEKHIQGNPDDPALGSIARQIVSAAWHLFSCFYPWEPERVRQSHLLRFMKDARISRVCEYRQIDGSTDSPCSGATVEAAHIRPHSQGGSDRAWNGIWLCGGHHRETEGRLSGKRDETDLSRLRVKLIR